MTNQEIELRIKNLEKNFAILASKQYSRHSSNSDKIYETDRNLDETKTTVELTSENVKVNESALNSIVEEVLPLQEGNISDVADTLDNLLTNVIPVLMNTVETESETEVE